jgi:hypothetical protein
MSESKTLAEGQPSAKAVRRRGLLGHPGITLRTGLAHENDDLEHFPLPVAKRATHSVFLRRAGSKPRRGERD